MVGQVRQEQQHLEPEKQQQNPIQGWPSEPLTPDQKQGNQQAGEPGVRHQGIGKRRNQPEEHRIDVLGEPQTEDPNAAAAKRNKHEPIERGVQEVMDRLNRGERPQKSCQITDLGDRRIGGIEPLSLESDPRIPGQSGHAAQVGGEAEGRSQEYPERPPPKATRQDLCHEHGHDEEPHRPDQRQQEAGDGHPRPTFPNPRVPQNHKDHQEHRLGVRDEEEHRTRKDDHEPQRIPRRRFAVDSEGDTMEQE